MVDGAPLMPPTVAVGAIFKGKYPYNPSEPPHLSLGKPEHGSVQSDVDVVMAGASLEHQHWLACNMANAKLSRQKS